MKKDQEVYPDTQNSWKPSKWVTNLAILILIAPISYKIAVTPFSLKVELSDLISLLLALFSVGLAAMFYFKASETSNSFYDNTYKFTKDIAELLVRIESGFGERLRHIDEGYSSMRDYFQTSHNRPKDNVEKTKLKIETEEQEIEKVVEERNEIIKQLVEKSQLQEEEKTQFIAQLKSKEDELSNVQRELAKLNRRLAFERASTRIERADKKELTGLRGFTYRNVIKKIGEDMIFSLSPTGIRNEFNKIEANLPRGYIRDLERNEYYNEGLTNEGALFLKRIVEDLNPE